MVQFDPKKTTFLIDGSSFLYRAYYGMRPLHTAKGEPVHAVYSFARMLKKLIDTYNPEYISLVWDEKGPTIRHEIFKDYKATRQAPPSDLFDQKEHIIKLADLIGLHQISRQGYEADDVMYALGLEQAQIGNAVVFVTSDKDMAQTLTQPNTYLYDYFKDLVITKESFEEKMEFPVERLPFYFSLLGDASDNIPGVRGIGKKGALDLVQQFSSLEDVYANLDKITKPRTKAALEINKENAFLSRTLFLLQTIDTKVTQKDLSFSVKNWPKARPLFQELAFKSLLKELGETKEDRAVITQEKIAYLDTLDLQCVTTLDALHALRDKLIHSKLFALDTETDGLRSLQCKLVGMSFCMDDKTAYYIPVAHSTNEPHLSSEQVIEVIKPILEDPSIHKVLHHAKFDALVLHHAGMELKGISFDTQVAASLVNESWQRTGLKALSSFYFDEHMLTFEEMVTAQQYADFSYVPLAQATKYAAFDARQTFKLHALFTQKLKDQNMESLHNTIEFPFIGILIEMEKRGIDLDVTVLQNLSKQVNSALETVTQEILTLIGPEFKSINFNSPRQIEKLLFTDLKLPPQKKSSKKTGYSTDQEVLEILADMHPVPALILKYRELFKIKSTYIESLPEYINPTDHRIHTTFSQTRVATGRLSSSDPNMQNIPVSGLGSIIRRAFKPVKGNVFISADYSQIELRVLAFLSQDPTLKQAFLEDKDIHAQTASRIFNIPSDQVTHEQRQIGKRINFSILYGLTPYGLSKDLKISFGDAKKYIDAYFEQYPKVQTWMDSIIQDTEKTGYVTTHWGRRRSIPAIYEKNKVLFDEAKRIAINTVAQGTAAEIVKQGMITFEAERKKQNLDALMLLQIHDEILISVPEKQAQAAEQLLKNVLESVVTWDIPLKVTTRIGSDWKDVSK